MKARLRHLLLWLFARGVAALTRLGGRPTPPPFDPRRVRRILVIRLDLLGDLVLSMPAVNALRRAYPEARIDLLALPYTAALAHLFPAVDGVIPFDVHQFRPSGRFWHPGIYVELFRLVQRLRRARYDLVVSLHGGHGSLFAYLSGAPWRVGYAGEAYAGTLTLPIAGRRYRERKHEVEYGLALARAAGGVADAPEYRAEVPADVAEKLAGLLADCGIRPEDTVVTIQVGASNGAAKRWRPAGWAEVADRLAEERRVRVVFAGVADERRLVARVLDRCTGRHLDLTGRTDLCELAALLARSAVVASGDTGPMHLAVALGTPVVVVHGPTDPSLSGPYGGPATVVRHDLPCSPCYDGSAPAECWRGDTLCMQLVTPDEVYTAITRYLRVEWGGPGVESERSSRHTTLDTRHSAP